MNSVDVEDLAAAFRRAAAAGRALQLSFDQVAIVAGELAAILRQRNAARRGWGRQRRGKIVFSSRPF